MNSCVPVTQLWQLINHGQYCVIYNPMHCSSPHTSIILNQISTIFFETINILEWIFKSKALFLIKVTIQKH